MFPVPRHLRLITGVKYVPLSWNDLLQLPTSVGWDVKRKGLNRVPAQVSLCPGAQGWYTGGGLFSPECT